MDISWQFLSTGRIWQNHSHWISSYSYSILISEWTSWIPYKSHDSFPQDVGCVSEIETIIGWLSVQDFVLHFFSLLKRLRFPILFLISISQTRTISKTSNYGQLELLRNEFLFIWPRLFVWAKHQECIDRKDQLKREPCKMPCGKV